MLNWIYNKMKSFREKLSEKGQGMVEYAVILAVVAAIAVAVLGQSTDTKDKETLSGAGHGAFENARTKINAAQ